MNKSINLLELKSWLDKLIKNKVHYLRMIPGSILINQINREIMLISNRIKWLNNKK